MSYDHHAVMVIAAGDRAAANTAMAGIAPTAAATFDAERGSSATGAAPCSHLHAAIGLTDAQFTACQTAIGGFSGATVADTEPETARAALLAELASRGLQVVMPQ